MTSAIEIIRRDVERLSNPMSEVEFDAEYLARAILELDERLKAIEVAISGGSGRPIWVPGVTPPIPRSDWAECTAGKNLTEQGHQAACEMAKRVAEGVNGPYSRPPE